MGDENHRSDRVTERLSALEAWKLEIDHWRIERAKLDTERHQENRESLKEIADALRHRDLQTEDSDKKRIERLDGIEGQLKTIALQTAHADGARELRTKIFGGFGQVALAAIGSGALLTLGRYAGAIARWLWPPPPHG